MVNQQIEDQSQQSLSQDSDGLDDFRIVDETTPEQLEIEAELDNESAQTVETQQTVDVEGEDLPVGRDTELREVQPEPQAQAPEEPVGQQVPQEPQTRQYSQDEVSKMQASWMKQITEAQEQARAAQEARNLETEVETRLRAQEESLRNQYGEEEARRLVRTTQNEQAIRGEVQLRQENQRLQTQLEQRQQNEENQAKSIVARQFMDNYGLQTEDFNYLLNTTTPEAMQTLAERLSTQTLQQRQQEQKLRAQVPAETPQTQLENGTSTGGAAESPQAKLNRLRGVPSYEWSDADYEFMRTGRM